MFRLSSLVLAVALAAAVPLRGQQPSTDVGVGLFPFLVGDMDGRITQVVDDCVARGADHVYVSVFRATGPQQGDLWITDNAGTWNSAWGAVRRTGAGIDLRALIAYAKSQGLRVVGVLRCFDSSVQPTDAAHRQYLLDVIGWLVDGVQPNGEPTYDLDGLALDYVRYVGAGGGNDPRPVTDFVAAVKERIGALTLHAYLIANRYSFDGPTYDGNFRSYAATLSILAGDFGQDWEALAPHLDVMMPMAYTADGSIYNTYALHQAYVRQCAAYAAVARNRGLSPATRVMPVVKTYDSSSETTTAQTVEASITGALLGGASGYQTFRYGTTRTSWWAKVQQYAVPGPDFPIAQATAAAQGLSIDVDASGSSSPAQPGAALQARFDWDDDGAFDTGWLAAGSVAGLLARHPESRWIGLRVRDSAGHVAATRRRVRVDGALGVGSSVYRSTIGGALQVQVDAGPRAAGHTYLVLASMSGSSPGTSWRGLDVPLNPDPFTELLLVSANTPVFTQALGSLDAAGRATATFWTPAGALNGFAFRGITWTAVGAVGLGTPTFASEPELTVILP